MKWIFKIALFVALVIAMNWQYEQWAYKEYVFREADQVMQIEKVKNADVIYLSASSNFSPRPQEEDPRKLSQFVGNYFPSLLFEAINTPASHAGSHVDLLRFIPEKNKIQTVVCVINLRSMGPDWLHSSLETALNKQGVMYQSRPPIINRFLTSLGAYDNKTIEEREDERADMWAAPNLPFPSPRTNVNEWCALYKWGEWTDPKRQLADQYIKQYAYVVDENNPRIKDLDEIVSVSKERSWNLVFSILSENIVDAELLAGPELTQLMTMNVEWIKSRYEIDAMVVDNLNLLEPVNFHDKDFPTEHYNEEGRKRIASNIAHRLKHYHKNAFRNAVWEAELNPIK